MVSAARRYLPKSLAAEVVTNMADYSGAQICISATPPLAQKHARYLVKRLTAVVPEAPILAGIWGVSEDRVKRLQSVTSVPIVTRAKDAVSEIKQRLAFPPQEEASLIPTAQA